MHAALYPITIIVQFPIAVALISVGASSDLENEEWRRDLETNSAGQYSRIVRDKNGRAYYGVAGRSLSDAESYRIFSERAVNNIYRCFGSCKDDCPVAGGVCPVVDEKGESLGYFTCNCPGDCPGRTGAPGPFTCDLTNLHESSSCHGVFRSHMKEHGCTVSEYDPNIYECGWDSAC